MARPLRIEFAGALYHITSRGDGRENIYLNDEDRSGFISLLGEVCERYNWTIHSYCLMTNHYHLLVETPDSNLAKGMRQLNGVYTQHFNRRHGRVGHVFQGRYTGILVQKDAYLLELSRYVVLNPARAGMVKKAGDWPWSSYRATVGSEKPLAWLETDWLLAQFGKRRRPAIASYISFVQAGHGKPGPWNEVKHQLYLGDENFIKKFKLDKRTKEELSEISRTQRRPAAKRLEWYQKKNTNRDEAMAQAYLSGAYSMKEIGEHFGVHYMTVSRAVRKLNGVK